MIMHQAEKSFILGILVNAIRREKGMKKRIKGFWIMTAALTVLIAMSRPTKSYAFEVTPIATIELYSTSGTPVYAQPDVFSPVVVYLDRFINVRVTGITDNGFFRVDLDGAYYIPGPYLVTQVKPEKTAKQKALDNLDKLTEAYRMQLQFMESYSASFGLKDVTGDGVPEIFDADGKEIYTYYEERPVMIYYSANPVSFYYSKDDNKLYGKYKWNDKTIWEAYYNDTSLLPWGQFKCISTVSSASGASAITRDYTNNDETRGDLYNILHEMLID